MIQNRETDRWDDPEFCKTFMQELNYKFKVRGGLLYRRDEKNRLYWKPVRGSTIDILRHRVTKAAAIYMRTAGKVLPPEQLGRKEATE